MKYYKILILLLTVSLSNCKVKTQNPSEIDIQLHQNVGSQSKFLFKYEFGGKGENAVDNSVFETILYVTLMSSNNNTHIYNIKSDTKKTSNIETLQDGEASILYFLIGTGMKVTCDQNGKMIEINNKNEIIEDLISIASDNNILMKWLENVRKENESMLFESIYKLNYESLLQYSKIKKTLPLLMESDSLIEKTQRIPESYSTIIEKNQKSGNLFEFSKLTTINFKELVQKEDLYETIIKPSKTTVSEILITNNKGLVQNLIVDSKTSREGMIMKSNGETISESGSFIENLKVEYNRIKQ